jgi:hypothetical protein
MEESRMYEKERTSYYHLGFKTNQTQMIQSKVLC